MVLLTIAVVAGVAAVASGLVSGGLDEPASSIPERALPKGPLTGQDVADLRFVPALRGYRMDQVDAAMAGLAAEIDRLRALVPAEVLEAATPAAEPGAPVSLSKPAEVIGTAEPFAPVEPAASSDRT
jgi:DivIVA domain-containing protein